MPDPSKHSLDPPDRLLLGPGPSTIPSRVLAAMARPTVGHLDPWFLQLLDRVQADLRHVFGTKNAVTLPISGTGSAGMETCFANLVEAGDEVVVGVNGVFGTRMAEVATRLGARVKAVEAPCRSAKIRRSWLSCTPKPRRAPGNRSKVSRKSRTMPARCCWSMP